MGICPWRDRQKEREAGLPYFMQNFVREPLVTSASRPNHPQGHQSQIDNSIRPRKKLLRGLVSHASNLFNSFASSCVKISVTHAKNYLVYYAHLVAYSLFLLFLNCSAWPCLPSQAQFKCFLGCLNFRFVIY